MKTSKKNSQKKRILAIDIGGSKIKMAVFDPRGRVVVDRFRQKTPRPATPAAVIKALVAMTHQMGPIDCISIGFPGVVQNGRTLNAANLHPLWKNVPLESLIRQKLRKPTRVLNDADMQGLASIKGRGLELVVTLGTGVGSGLFYNGQLIPNLELGHQLFRDDKSYEDILGQKNIDKKGPVKWNKALRLAIQDWEKLFNYDYLYLGGGNSKEIEGPVPKNVEITPNKNGLLGGIHLWPTR